MVLQLAPVEVIVAALSTESNTMKELKLDCDIHVRVLYTAL